MRAIGNSVGVTASCVKKTYRYVETQSLQDPLRSARRSAMSSNDHRYVIIMAKPDRFKADPALQEEYNCGIKEGE